MRKAAKPIPPPEEIPEPTPEPVEQASSAGGGTQGGQAGGAGGDAEETSLNKKGNSLTAGQTRPQMTGKTLRPSLIHH